MLTVLQMCAIWPVSAQKAETRRFAIGCCAKPARDVERWGKENRTGSRCSLQQFYTHRHQLFNLKKKKAFCRLPYLSYLSVLFSLIARQGEVWWCFFSRGEGSQIENYSNFPSVKWGRPVIVGILHFSVLSKKVFWLLGGKCKMEAAKWNIKWKTAQAGVMLCYESTVVQSRCGEPQQNMSTSHWFPGWAFLFACLGIMV